MSRTIRTAACTAALAVALLTTSCTSDDAAENNSPAADSSTSVTASEPPIIIPGQSGEPNRTVSAEEANSVIGDDLPDAADIEFATMMVPHHQQAIRLVEMVEGRSTNTGLISLAERMDAEQVGEIEVLKTWLKDHDIPELAGADLDEHLLHMAGSISQDQFTQIEASTGTEFDRQFLTAMIAHHQGAVDMADVALSEGTNASIRVIAGDVAVGQAAQVDAMNVMLAELK